MTWHYSPVTGQLFLFYLSFIFLLLLLFLPLVPESPCVVHKTLFKIQLLTIVTTNTGHLARLILFITQNVDKKAYSNQTTCLLVFKYGLTLYGSHGHCTFLMNTVRSTVTFPHEHRRYVTHVNTARFRWTMYCPHGHCPVQMDIVQMHVVRSTWTLFRWALYGPCGHSTVHTGNVRFTRALYGPHGHCTVHMYIIQMEDVRSTLITLYG